MQRPGTAGGARLTFFFQNNKSHRLQARWLFFSGPCQSLCGTYLVPPGVGVPPGVMPAFAAAALDSGVGMGLVPVALVPVEVLELEEPVAPLSLEGVDGTEGVDGVVAGVEGVAPVSSTFLPQAPSASRAANAIAVAAAGLNLDACMSVSFYELKRVDRSTG